MSKTLTRGDNNLFAARNCGNKKDLQALCNNESLIKALEAKRKEKAGRPKTGENKNNPGKRQTIIIDPLKLNEIKKISIAETITQSEFIDIALDLLLTRYKKTGLLK